jgi:LPS-assembly lipoprotein
LSSDFISNLARITGVVTLIVVPLALSSCQVRPLYAESTGVTAKLSSVSFSPASTRVAQEVRNQLIFIAGRGAGEPTKPLYNVTLTATAGTAGVLYLASSDTSQAGRTVVTASFVLKNASDGKVLKAGSRSAVALVDFPTQEFAKQRAIRDSEDRAAREAAELVGADISAALSR